MLFYRASFTELSITISSNEELGLLNTGYIQDYNGVDGQLTIFNVSTTAVHSLIMSAVPSATPGVNNDVFKGSILLSTLPDGNYQLRGRVKDLYNNHTILTKFGSPVGNEKVMPFLFTISSGQFVPFPGRTINVKGSNRVINITTQERTINVKGQKRVMP